MNIPSDLLMTHYCRSDVDYYYYYYYFFATFRIIQRLTIRNSPRPSSGLLKKIKFN